MRLPCSTCSCVTRNISTIEHLPLRDLDLKGDREFRPFKTIAENCGDVENDVVITMVMVMTIILIFMMMMTVMIDDAGNIC